MADNMNVTVRDPLAPRRQMPPIVIGRAGEYGATTVTFDLRGFIDRYGAGVPTLLHKRPPDDEAYIVPLSAADTETHDRTEMPDSETLVWHVGQVATSYVGNGKIELQWHPEGAAKKSAQFDVVVLGTIGNPVSEIPDAQQIYLDVMQGIADDAEDAADRAEAAATAAEDAAERAEEAGGDVSPEAIAEAVEDYFDEHPIDVPTDAVLYTPQTLTDAQKEQARENVDAPSASVLAAMLIPILRDGLYGTDQQAAITALEIALGGTPEPEDPIETYTPTMSDGYINVTTGATGGTSTYKHTEIIPVREGDKVYGTTYDSTYSVTVQRIRSRFTAAYDANGEIYPSGGVSDQHDYAVETPFVVPSGVYGVVFSIVNSLANQVVVYVDKSERVGA